MIEVICNRLDKLCAKQNNFYFSLEVENKFYFHYNFLKKFTIEGHFEGYLSLSTSIDELILR